MSPQIDPDAGDLIGNGFAGVTKATINRYARFGENTDTLDEGVPGDLIAQLGSYRGNGACNNITFAQIYCSDKTNPGSELQGSLSRVFNVGQHAGERMIERGITPDIVKISLRKGQTYFDPKNKTIHFALEKGFASGKDLLVGVNFFTKRISTTLKRSQTIE